MRTSKGTLRICSGSHEYYKSSSCPVCPVCEKEKVPEVAFLSLVSAPARRALEREGITTLTELSRWTERDLLKLHGLGPSALPKLKAALEAEGLGLREM